jgi:hypothetical protein
LYNENLKVREKLFETLKCSSFPDHFSETNRIAEAQRQLLAQGPQHQGFLQRRAGQSLAGFF